MFTGNPLKEYQLLEKKYVDLLQKVETYKRKLQKLKKEEKNLNTKVSLLNQEEKKLIQEITFLTNIEIPSESNLPLLLAILSPQIREKYLLEQEVSFEIQYRIKKIISIENKLNHYKKTIQQRISETKKLIALTTEIEKEIKKEKRKKLEIIRKIFSNPENVRKFIAFRHKSLENTTIQVIGENSSKSLEKLKGELDPPVTGKLIKKYGPYYDPLAKIDLFSPGIEIATKPYTPVKAVYSGIVEFEGPVEGYDYVIIIKHPGDIYSVYGHLSIPIVRKGDLVDIGEVIGVTANYGKNSNLYFEIRKGGSPVNPLRWIKFPGQNK